MQRKNRSQGKGVAPLFFKELYIDIPFQLLGRENKTLDWMLQDTYEIYDKENEEKYGVLRIRFEKIKAYSVKHRMRAQVSGAGRSTLLHRVRSTAIG